METTSASNYLYIDKIASLFIERKENPRVLTELQSLQENVALDMWDLFRSHHQIRLHLNLFIYLNLL